MRKALIGFGFALVIASVFLVQHFVFVARPDYERLLAYSENSPSSLDFTSTIELEKINTIDFFEFNFATLETLEVELLEGTELSVPKVVGRRDDHSDNSACTEDEEEDDQEIDWTDPSQLTERAEKYRSEAMRLRGCSDSTRFQRLLLDTIQFDVNRNSVADAVAGLIFFSRTLDKTWCEGNQGSCGRFHLLISATYFLLGKSEQARSQYSFAIQLFSERVDVQEYVLAYAGMWERDYGDELIAARLFGAAAYAMETGKCPSLTAGYFMFFGHMVESVFHSSDEKSRQRIVAGSVALALEIEKNMRETMDICTFSEQALFYFARSAGRRSFESLSVPK